MKSLPKNFPTFIYRRYTIIKDGIVHVDSLPVRVDKATATVLKPLLPPSTKFKAKRGLGLSEVVIDLTKMPVINRQMVLEASARELFELQWKLVRQQAAQKVYKYYRDLVVEKKDSKSFRLTYGNDEAEWLKSAGFTEYSGFCPKVVAAETTDAYLDKELQVAIKGLSLLPKVEDVIDRLEKAGKLTISMSLMAPYIREVQAETARLGAKTSTYKTWIQRKADDAIAEARRLLAEIARIKLAVVLGQTWFKEFATLDDNSMEMDFDEHKGVHCEVKMKEVEIKV